MKFYNLDHKTFETNFSCVPILFKTSERFCQQIFKIVSNIVISKMFRTLIKIVWPILLIKQYSLVWPHETMLGKQILVDGQTFKHYTNSKVETFVKARLYAWPELLRSNPSVNLMVRTFKHT